MATSAKIINDAMFAIGASSPINPAHPDLIVASFDRLIDWLTMMKVDGVEVAGIDYDNLPSEPGTELGNDAGTNLPLGAGLAPWIAPLFQITLTLEAKGAADHAMQSLYGTSLAPDFPEYPETLPVGSGNTRGPKGRVYYPAPEDPFGRGIP